MKQEVLSLVSTLSSWFANPKPRIEGTCVEHDAGLTWLAELLSGDAIISCRGEPWQTLNANRYWGEQYGKSADVVVFPATTRDVSVTVRATQKTELGQDYAFVAGAHSMTNSSSSSGFVIDLKFLNHTEVVHDFQLGDETITAIAYGAGTTTAQFQEALNGTGWTGIAARVASVGMGGFSTGGGIGYLAGAYGYASDRVVAAEVVLPSGEIVFATEGNEYSDLIWALRGAGLGQFGIVTTFYQRAVPEPKSARVAFYILAEESLPKSYENTAEFYASHDDPFSLLYYTFGFVPADMTDPTPKPSDFSVQSILTTVWLEEPKSSTPKQKPFEETFAPMLSGLKFLGSAEYTVPYANLATLGAAWFPYGSRRGFFGPASSRISAAYLQEVQREFNSYIDSIKGNGDFPAASTFTLQYMSPGLSGNLPKSDEDTAWPHSHAGHQTLFNPGWSSPSSDAIAEATNTFLNSLVYSEQAKAAGPIMSGTEDADAELCGGTILCDYPNYISPDVSGKRVWGKNIPRLISIKDKYDPQCTLHTGRVFASEGCVAKGVANVYA
jgi:FAD/FMN-containing dehydrogenase